MTTKDEDESYLNASQEPDASLGNIAVATIILGGILLAMLL